MLTSANGCRGALCTDMVFGGQELMHRGAQIIFGEGGTECPC